MKKRDIRITLIIIAVSFGIFYLYYFTNSLVNGYVEIDAGGADADLNLVSSFFSKVRLTSGTGPVLINKRILKPQSLILSKNQHGQTLKISSRGPWGNLSLIKLKNNETIKIRLGQPLLIKPNISKTNNAVTVGFSIVGQAGEIYDIPRREPVPKINIIDEQGNTIATGNFAYG